jgi:hypothetical protein
MSQRRLILGHMFAPEQAAGIVREYLSDLDPAALTAAEAERGLLAFTTLGHLAAAGKTLCAARAVQTGAHTRAGFQRPGEWLARLTGSTLGEALALLDTAKALPELHKLDEAMRNGDVSPGQAAAVAKGAGGDEKAERQLLDHAKANLPLRELRDKARRMEAARNEESERRDRDEQLHANRYLRTRIGHDGAVLGEFSLAPLQGASFLAALELEQTRIFEQARRRGDNESSAKYAADALVALAGRDAGQARSASQVVLHVDLAAFRRGEAWPGEMCEIPGVGPVPVAVARQILGEAFLKLVITDGVDIAGVTHIGRVIPAAIRTALEARDPVCVVPGCGSAWQLEIDHWQIPYAQGGPTELANLARCCRYHHRLKTHKGWRLEGGPGRWRWLSPDGHDASRPDWRTTQSGTTTASPPPAPPPDAEGHSPPNDPGAGAGRLFDSGAGVPA